MSLVETYVKAKGDQLSKKLGLKHCLVLEVEDYNLGFHQGAHLTLSDVKLDMDDMKPLLTEAQLAFVSMWENSIDFLVRINGKTLSDIKKYGVGDSEFNFSHDDIQEFPEYEYDKAFQAFSDAEAKAVNIMTEASSVVAAEIKDLEDELFANLQDALLYNSQDELVREIKTKNFSVLIYEAESGFFENDWIEEEYVIQEVEAFKDGKNRGFDIKVVIKDNKGEVITDTYSAYTIGSSEKLKVSDYRSFVSDAIYEARQQIKKSQAA